jgi:holo-[acyl-carrier protein] synthase
VTDFARVSRLVFESTGSVVGVGLDLAEAVKTSRWLQRHDAQVLKAVFSDGELAETKAAEDGARHLARCFACKEAVGKALGSGLAGIDWTEIELHDSSRGPVVRLSGKAADLARSVGAESFTLWESEWSDLAVMTAIATSEALKTSVVHARLSLFQTSALRQGMTRFGDRFLERLLPEAEASYVRGHADPMGAAGARLAARRALADLWAHDSPFAHHAAASAMARERRIRCLRSRARVVSRQGLAPELELGVELTRELTAMGLSQAHVSLSHAAGKAAALLVFGSANEAG